MIKYKNVIVTIIFIAVTGYALSYFLSSERVLMLKKEKIESFS